MSTAGATYLAKDLYFFLRNTLVFVPLVIYLYVFVLVLRAVLSQLCVQCGWRSVLQARKQDATCTLQANIYVRFADIVAASYRNGAATIIVMRGVCIGVQPKRSI